MADGVVTALIAGLSALGGAAVAHWGALRLQAQRLDREVERERAALRRQQRAELLGWVLEARTRIEALSLRSSEEPHATDDKTAAAAARQAYAAALLSLAAARPAAKAFYQSTARLQLVLEKPSAEDFLAAAKVATASWQADYEAIETLIASMSDE